MSSRCYHVLMSEQPRPAATADEHSYLLSVKEAAVDEEEPQLLCQEILNERVASIDDALARLKDILTSSA
jgi:hypothetical protein